MVGDSSSGSGHGHDEAQGMEVLRVELLTRETVLKALTENVDHKFQALEGHFDKIADRLDALAIGASRGRNEDRRGTSEDVAQGQPVNRPVSARRSRQSVYSDDLEKEEDFMYADHRLARGGGRREYTYERDSGDLKLKIDISFFSGNLNIEDFFD